MTPSRVDAASDKPFTLDQTPAPFGRWIGDPIWAPPLGSSKELARTMLRQTGWFTPAEERWEAVVDRHRDDFTQVREIELAEASIRLPKGRFFVSVTERDRFDTIEEEIPACVQTRLDEFLDGPGRRRGVKVYYLEPLCVEVGDELILTTREALDNAIAKIRGEVFAEYRSSAALWRIRDTLVAAADLGLAIPRGVARFVIRRRQKAIDALHARLEFERRKTALRAAKAHRRGGGCSFDEMLSLTTPLRQEAVIRQYGAENKLSHDKTRQLIEIAGGSAPWFVTLSLAAAQIASYCLTAAAPSVLACDPAFVAELPERPGALLKIGHFDRVGGVMHVEI